MSPQKFGDTDLPLRRKGIRFRNFLRKETLKNLDTNRVRKICVPAFPWIKFSSEQFVVNKSLRFCDKSQYYVFYIPPRKRAAVSNWLIGRPIHVQILLVERHL